MLPQTPWTSHVQRASAAVSVVERTEQPLGFLTTQSTPYVKNSVLTRSVKQFKERQLVMAHLELEFQQVMCHYYDEVNIPKTTHVSFMFELKWWSQNWQTWTMGVYNSLDHWWSSIRRNFNSKTFKFYIFWPLDHEFSMARYHPNRWGGQPVSHDTTTRLCRINIVDLLVPRRVAVVVPLVEHKVTGPCIIRTWNEHEWCKPRCLDVMANLPSPEISIYLYHIYIMRMIYERV